MKKTFILIIGLLLMLQSPAQEKTDAMLFERCKISYNQRAHTVCNNYC